MLSDGKNCLEEIVGTGVCKHLEIANSITEAWGVKIRSRTSNVEERLKRESRRYIVIASYDYPLYKLKLQMTLHG